MHWSMGNHRKIKNREQEAKAEERKKKHREEQEKKKGEKKSPKDANPWSKVASLIDLNMMNTKDVSRMKQCILSKLNEGK